MSAPRIMAFTLTFLIGCVSLTLLCDCAGTFSPGTSDAIVPLETGNIWVYRITTTLRDRLTEEERERATDITYTIERDTIIDGERWFTHGTEALYGMRDQYHGRPAELCINRRDGFWVRQGEHESLVIPYPARVGDTGRTLSGATVRVTSIDTLVIVPAGEFHCYRYEVSETRYHYAPGVGLVSYETPVEDLIATPYESGVIALSRVCAVSSRMIERSR